MLFENRVTPDFEGMLKCVLQKEEPKRVYHLELFLDAEMKLVIAEQFDLMKDVDTGDPHFDLIREIRVHEFLGYDLFAVGLTGFDFPLYWQKISDTTEAKTLARKERDWIDEHKGPIQSWDDFEEYPWPKIRNLNTRPLEWFEKNLPEGMAIYVLTSHILENLSWLFGYEKLCYLMFDDPELVEAVATKVGQLYLEHIKALCQFSRIGVIWGTDDMGFKSQTLLSPDALRKLVLPWHKKSAELAHKNGKPYFIHTCGNVEFLMEDLIHDVKIDAKHSFEDTIEPVTEAKRKYGSRIGLLGGIDMDILCRGSEEDVRRKTRETLDICQPGGGYCLGSGNTIANYMPLDNYLAMLDEGRKY